MAHLMLRTGAGAVWPLKNDLSDDADSKDHG
jgi:hypothetical protein